MFKDWVMFKVLACLAGAVHSMVPLDIEVVRALRASPFELTCSSTSMYVGASWLSRKSWSKELMAGVSPLNYIFITSSGVDTQL